MCVHKGYVWEFNLFSNLSLAPRGYNTHVSISDLVEVASVNVLLIVGRFLVVVVCIRYVCPFGCKMMRFIV